MSYKLTLQEEKVVAIFTNTVEENEIKNAFLEIVDTIRIKELKLLVIDFTTIHSYVIPKDYMTILKTITKFSSAWNTEVKVVIIATNPEIRKVVTAIINNKVEHSWEYQLYNDIETARKFNSEV